MLKTFITCPLDYYFKYVMEFGEKDKVEEEVENNTFGTFIHTVLEDMYRPFARHDEKGELKSPQPPAITSLDIDRMLGLYELEITKQFLKHFNNDREAFTKGKNLLSYKMALKLTERFLKVEKKFLLDQTQPVFIEYLERELISELEIDVFGTKKKVRLKGFVDRIDSIGEAIRIVDYKSGKVKLDDCKITGKGEIESVFTSVRNRKHVLQLMMYAYLYHATSGIVPQEAGIISFINISDGFIPLNTSGLNTAELIEVFPAVVQNILEEMYDREVPFEHTKNDLFSFCMYCV
jgi:ATP-dependent helicase/nuclease subunit B